MGSGQADEPGAPRRGTFLTTLEAAVARIVPSDDGPGAIEAGTSQYVLAAAPEGSARLAQLHELVRHLDRATRTLGLYLDFAALHPTDQDRVLAEVEREADSTFDWLVATTLEGFYGDPRYGGNRNALSWRLIGFPGPHPAGYASPLGWYDANVERD